MDYYSPTLRGWKAELAWLVDPYLTFYTNGIMALYKFRIIIIIIITHKLVMSTIDQA